MTMESLELQNIKSRIAAEEALKKQIYNLQIRQFLLKNLFWVKKNELGWKINLPVIKQNLDEVLIDMSDYRITIPTLFLKGGDSDYILPEDEASIKKQFPNATIVAIPGTDHWLHAEKPDEFYRITMAFFSQD